MRQEKKNGKRKICKKKEKNKNTETLLLFDCGYLFMAVVESIIFLINYFVNYNTRTRKLMSSFGYGCICKLFFYNLVLVTSKDNIA